MSAFGQHVLMLSLLQHIAHVFQEVKPLVSDAFKIGHIPSREEIARVIKPKLLTFSERLKDGNRALDPDTADFLALAVAGILINAVRAERTHP